MKRRKDEKIVVSKENISQNTSSHDESITLDETEIIQFTPVNNKNFPLPYETPFNLHQSMSEEFQSCSSPVLAPFSNENSHFPSTPPNRNTEEILLDETPDTIPAHPDEKLLEENHHSFLAKGPPQHSSS